MVWVNSDLKQGCVLEPKFSHSSKICGTNEARLDVFEVLLASSGHVHERSSKAGARGGTKDTGFLISGNAADRQKAVLPVRAPEIGA